MTDATLPVTQSVVEQFTEQYLRSLGSSIEKRGGTWDVTIPGSADTELPTGQISLRCDTDATNSDSNSEALHSESKFFQQILTEVGERAPTGRIEVEAEETEIILPDWLQESNVTVSSARFTPYYDRTAVVALYQISVETVSEYQQEFLRAIAIDARSEELLPELEQTFLELTAPESGGIESGKADLSREKVADLLEATREPLLDRIQPQINEIHQEASRAADAEVEEYRQMQQQRVQELDEQLSDLSSRIEDLNETVDSSTQKERVQALKERKQLKSEYDELEAEVTDIRDRREQGFPERQREIRERHALEVTVSPLTVTQVDYERGEVEIELEDEGTTQTLTVGYGSGVGVTEDILCSNCDRVLSVENPLEALDEEMRCLRCNKQRNDT